MESEERIEACNVHHHDDARRVEGKVVARLSARLSLAAHAAAVRLRKPFFHVPTHRSTNTLALRRSMYRLLEFLFLFLLFF